MTYSSDRSNDPHLFYEDSAAEYTRAIHAAGAAVTRFLQQNDKPFSGITPDQLKDAFDAVDFNAPLPDYQSLLDEVESLYTRHAVAFHLPQYVAHLNCPIVIPAIAAEVMISAINSSLDTWDQSAGGTLMEQKLISWTCNEIGFDHQADGIFTSGGTQSNLMALLLARDHFAQETLQYNIKKNGLPPSSSRFRIFASEAGHFSIQKNAALLGLGEQAVVKIKTNDFRMDADALEAAIRLELNRGNLPIAVVATAGTTDFGTIDPLMGIGLLAAKYNLWFHVDAAYGCGLLLTEKYRHLLNGIQLAHSVTVDYHKSFFQPVSSSGFLVRHKSYLSLLKHHADYLNPKEHEEDGLPDQVNKSLQTTRRFDALKLWFTLRLMGKEKLGAYFEKIIATTTEVADLIDDQDDFELLNRSDISALVFRYLPYRMAQSPDTLNRHIRKEMFRSGSALVAGTRVNGSFYLKLTLLNPLTTPEHIRELLQLIREYGHAYTSIRKEEIVL